MSAMQHKVLPIVFLCSCAALCAASGGIKELLFKCDDNQGLRKGLVQLPDVLQTVNSNSDIEKHLKLLRKNQAQEGPVFVTELWTGWYSAFGHPFGTKSGSELLHGLEQWLDAGASVNFYMWHGGSNFHHNGLVLDPVRVLAPSYDYDAPVSENGTLTRKFYALREMLKQKLETAVQFGSIPPDIPVKAYGPVEFTRPITLSVLTSLVPAMQIEQVCSMEDLPLTNDSGQALGWTLYRHQLGENEKPQSVLVPELADYGVVIFNGRRLGTVQYRTKSSFPIPPDLYSEQTPINRLDILVAHMGRNNYLPDGSERKGLLKPVVFDGSSIVKDWSVRSFEFDFVFNKMLSTTLNNGLVQSVASSFLKLTGQKQASWNSGELSLPGIVYGEFTVDDAKPRDTFLKLGEHFHRGLVILNGEVLGRHWEIGPQRTLYVPAPLLRSGRNQVLVAELDGMSRDAEASLVDKPILK